MQVDLSNKKRVLLVRLKWYSPAKSCTMYHFCTFESVKNRLGTLHRNEYNLKGYVEINFIRVTHSQQEVGPLRFF